MTRRYQNNYSTTITTTSVGTGDTSFDVTTAPGALSGSQYYIATITDSLTAPTKTEIIKVPSISGTTFSSISRAQEGTTAQTWASGDFVEIRITDASLETLDNPTINDATESTSTDTGTVLTSSGKRVWERTLTANDTFTDGLAEGQDLTMHLIGGDTYTPTWPTSTVVGDWPALPAKAVLVFWKLNGTLYRQYSGSYT